MGGDVPPLSHMALWNGACLIKHGDNFVIGAQLCNLADPSLLPSDARIVSWVAVKCKNTFLLL
jgi:hypothetical protein